MNEQEQNRVIKRLLNNPDFVRQLDVGLREFAAGDVIEYEDDEDEDENDG